MATESGGEQKKSDKSHASRALRGGVRAVLAAAALHAGSDVAAKTPASNWRTHIQYQAVRETPQASKFMHQYHDVEPPQDYNNFCLAFVDECREDSRTPRELAQRRKISDAVFYNVVDVNRDVNMRIKPMSDKQQHGVKEKWTIPTTYGDCEDYALLKRKILIEQYGWFPSQLLMTVLDKPSGERHAVLAVRTDRGDFILDNSFDDVRLWNELSEGKEQYDFLFQKSPFDMKVWKSLKPVGAGRKKT